MVCVFAQREQRGLPEPFIIICHHRRHVQLWGQVPHFWSMLPSVMCLLWVIAVYVVFDLLPEINKEQNTKHSEQYFYVCPHHQM